MGEIIEEAADYTPRFMNSCGIEPLIHSQTVRLMSTLSMMAYSVVVCFKDKYKQPRPSQMERLIKPAIPVPAHYSYPSGHSTQANLIRMMLKDVFAETKFKHKVPQHLDYDAEQIAENREWAGLHYRSDTKAGIILARQIYNHLGAKTPRSFTSLKDSAISEWN